MSDGLIERLRIAHSIVAPGHYMALVDSDDLLEAATHIAMLEDERKRLRYALRELVAIVRGECPSLLSEDSGGSADLDIEIDTLLQKDGNHDGCAGRRICDKGYFG